MQSIPTPITSQLNGGEKRRKGGRSKLKRKLSFGKTAGWFTSNPVWRSQTQWRCMNIDFEEDSVMVGDRERSIFFWYTCTEIFSYWKWNECGFGGHRKFFEWRCYVQMKLVLLSHRSSFEQAHMGSYWSGLWYRPFQSWDWIIFYVQLTFHSYQLFVIIDCELIDYLIHVFILWSRQ